MRYTFLTHKKQNSKHYLYLDIDMSSYDFFVESSFIATDSYYFGEQVFFNDELYTAVFTPDINALFGVNDCVYCVIDMKHKKFLITDIHKAACDSLIIFNNFSNNPTASFNAQSSILFSKSFTIANDTDQYQDIIIGGCIILENAMSEDGVGSFTMYLEVFFNNTLVYTYCLDCTRKHECLCFDHLFKNIKTNEKVDMYIRYHFDSNKYGSSYVSPTIYNNNVTFYIEGSNISYGDSSSIFVFSITDENNSSGYTGYGSKGPYATVSGIIDKSLAAYRVPDTYTENGVTYPVKQFYISETLPNCKYIAFGNNIEVIYTPYVYTNDMLQYGLYNYDYVYRERAGYFKNRGVIVIFPDSGLRYVYGSDNYNNYGGFYNDAKSFEINCDPERLVYYYYDLGGSSLPRGEYPTFTLNNVGAFFGNYYNTFRKSNMITINAEEILMMQYSNTYYSYRNTSYTGVSYFDQASDDNFSIQEPSNNIQININCKVCNTYYLMYYFHIGRAIWDPEEFAFEYDKYKGYSTSVFNPNIVRVYEQKVVFNIKGTLSDIYNYPTYSTSDIKKFKGHFPLLSSISENSSTGEITYSTSSYHTNPNNSAYLISSYNTYNTYYNYASSRGYNALVRPLLIVNLDGDSYSSLYASCYYAEYQFNIKNMYSIPLTTNCGGISSSAFPNYYICNAYTYKEGHYFATSYNISGTYDISKKLIKAIVRRITARQSWYFDDQGNKLESSKYFTKTWEPNYAITPSFRLRNFLSYSNSYMYYFKKFHVHRLEGIVFIPCKNTYSSSYSIYPEATEGDISVSPSYHYFYHNTWCDFKYDEIADDTIILSFGHQDLSTNPIDFSKLSCIGNLDYCNITRIELENPIVAFLIPPSTYNMWHPYMSYYDGYEYETEDGQWDPNWNKSSDSSIGYTTYIDFNAVCLGPIDLIYEDEKISDEEIEGNDYIKYIMDDSSTHRDEDIAEMEEKLAAMDETTRMSNSSYNYRKIECGYYHVKLPKKSNIALGVEDFSFDRTSEFNFHSNYTTINDELIIYPEIKLYDCTKYIGRYFLNSHPYYPERDGDVFSLPANLKFFGDYCFKFYLFKKVIVDGNVSYKYFYEQNDMSFYGYQKDGTTYGKFEFIEDSIFEGYPLSEVRIGKYLEVLPEIFAFADRLTIDPENPNFVIQNGYIFNADMTVLYRPVCYTEQAAYERTAQNEFVFRSNVLTTIVDYRAFKNDKRIIGIEITTDTFTIKDNPTANLYLPDNCTRIILPSGQYTIIDSDFDKLEYIEFLNITENSKYYTIPGSTAGDIYSTFSKTYRTWYNYPGTTSATASNSGITVSGTRIIYIRQNEDLTLPNACVELGGKVSINTLTITEDRNSEFNISNPNVKIHAYDVEGSESIFYKNSTKATYIIEGESEPSSDVLWARMRHGNPSSSPETKKFLYRVPTGPSMESMTIDLDYDTYINACAFKYCNISNLTIHALPNGSTARNFSIFSIPCFENNYATAVPYGFYNEYDHKVYYDEDNVDNIYQYALSNGSNTDGWDFVFNQLHYKWRDNVAFRVYQFNQTCLPVLNNHLDSLTIDFDPNYITGSVRNRYGSPVIVSSRQRQIDNNTGSTVSFERISYDGNFCINIYTLPEIDDFYINYDYRNDSAIDVQFPIDERYGAIHFDSLLIDGITSITSLIVSGPDVKIYPSNLLENITIHQYRLYFCTNTNLYVSATSFTNNTFGEQCGTPFPSNETITLDNCFIHPLFVHPEKCENINLILNTNTRFGYCTSIVTSGSLVSEGKNMLTQYSDYARSWNSNSYFTGTTDQMGKYIFFLSPMLSRSAYMQKQLSIFSHITSPRLFSYLFRSDNISSNDDTYRIFNGTWFELNCDTLVSIPYYCFDVEQTDSISDSGYNLFTYQEFHDMLLDLISIDKGNRIQIPVNPSGTTDYEFSTTFVDWNIPWVSRRQQRIDSWTIQNDRINNFNRRNFLIHFIDNIIFKNTSVASLFFGRIYYGSSSYTYDVSYTNHTSYVYDYFTGTEPITISIKPDPNAVDNQIVDIGVDSVENFRNYSSGFTVSVQTSYAHNNFNLDFEPNNTYVIRQLIVPNGDSDELDFTSYSNCSFILGDNANAYPYSLSSYRRNGVRISGFKRIVFGPNVSLGEASIYTGSQYEMVRLPNLVFFNPLIEEVEYLGTELYGILNNTTSNNISTTFGDDITTVDTIFCGKSTTAGLIKVDLNRVETLIGWRNSHLYQDMDSIAYSFCNCDFTDSTFDYLVSIASYAGIISSRFSSQVTMPNVLTIGDNGMKENIGIEELSLPLCTSTGASSFRDNTTITSLSAPSLVTIGEYAFYNCPIAGVLTLESAETIGTYAFNSLDITEVYLPSATDIASYAFYSCRNITKAYIPAGCNITITSFYNDTEIVRT